MNPLYKKSVKDVTQRKLRAVLTILGIVVGVLGLTAIINSQRQLNSAFKYSQDAAGQPDITFYTSPATSSAIQGIRDWTNGQRVEAVGFLYPQWLIPQEGASAPDAARAERVRRGLPGRADHLLLLQHLAQPFAGHPPFQRAGRFHPAGAVRQGPERRRYNARSTQHRAASSLAVTTDWRNAPVMGVEPSAQLYRKNLVAGRWFNAMDTNVVVISTQARDASHLRVGDIITVRDKLHTAHWRIIGVVVDNNGILTRFGQMIVPLEETGRFRQLPLSLTDGLMVGSTSQDQAAVDKLSRRIDDKLAATGIQATVMTSKQLKDTIASEVNVLIVMLYAVAIIVALVGAIGLFNTLAMSVLERRREIGILRSMGATGRKVAGVFWTEGMSLGILAWVLGVATGIPVAYGFVWIIQTVLMPVPFVFNPFSVVVMLVFIAVIATLASVIPVWGAARVRIAQTLRYDG